MMSIHPHKNAYANPSSLKTALVSLVLLFTAHGAPANQHALSQQSTTLPDLSVSVAWLMQHQHAPDLLLLDARTLKAYQKDHIESAVSLPVNSTFGPLPRVDLLAPINVVQALLRKAGVDSSKRIIIYDNGEAIHAARLFWAMEAYGLRQVAILDGGMPAWRAAGGRLSEVATLPTASDYVAQINPKSLTTKLKVRMGLNRPNKVLIDVRTPDEYQGKTSKSKRFGHIPGAVSVPWTKNFTSVNGVKVLRPKSELAELYRSLIPEGGHTTAYCNKGKQSALTYVVLRRLGYPVSAYDGSWYEWGNDESLPITTPASVTKQQTSNPAPSP